METFTLDRVLDREYVVLDTTWTSADARGTNLATLQFPTALFAIPFITEKINNFRYFKAGVRLSIRLNTSGFYYGKIRVNFIPRPFDNKYRLEAQDIIIGSGYEHVLLSASSGSTVVFDVPFIHKYRYLNLNSFDPAELGEFNVTVVSPLKSGAANIVCSAGITITAQFLEAKLVLPKDPAISEIMFFPQSMSTVTANRSIAKDVYDREADMKAKSDSISMSHQVTRLTKSVVKLSQIGASMAAVAGMVAGLSKPRTVQQGAIYKVNQYSDFNNGSGVDLGQSFSILPECALGDAKVGGVDKDEMALATIVGTPMSIGHTSIDVSDSYFSLSTIGRVELVNVLPFCDFVARQFDSFVGTYKYMLYFTASKMHDVRVAIYISSELVTDYQNCYHKVVDITGDTEVDFSVPYLGQGFSSRGDTVFYLNMKLLSWSQSDPSLSLPIDVEIYKAMADDACFYGLQQYRFQAQSCPRVQFGRTFAPLHPSMKAYSQAGLIAGEQVTSVREIIHRFTPLINVGVGSTAGNNYVQNYGGGGGSGNLTTSQYAGTELWGLLYAFWRGGMNHKFVKKDTFPDSAYFYKGGTVMTGASFATRENPMLDVTVPYYSDGCFTTTKPLSNLNSRVYFGLAATAQPGAGNLAYNKGYFWCTSAADDFSFHYICPPPKPNGTGLKIMDDTIQGTAAMNKWFGTA